MKLTKADLPNLPQRFTNAYIKCYEQNMYQFNLGSKPAEEESLIHVGRLVYLWKSEQQAKKEQFPLFEVTPAPKRRGVADAHK